LSSQPSGIRGATRLLYTLRRSGSGGPASGTKAKVPYTRVKYCATACERHTASVQTHAPGSCSLAPGSSRKGLRRQPVNPPATEALHPAPPHSTWAGLAHAHVRVRSTACFAAGLKDVRNWRGMAPRPFRPRGGPTGLSYCHRVRKEGGHTRAYQRFAARQASARKWEVHSLLFKAQSPLNGNRRLGGARASGSWVDRVGRGSPDAAARQASTRLRKRL